MNINVTPKVRNFDGRTVFMWVLSSKGSHVLANGCELTQQSAYTAAERAKGWFAMCYSGPGS